ncbi:response regulator transcription factor [Pseudooceanicola nanhaiensis]|uniref:response regulator transcription factor n=1 Tax=Pseudooceanicola nanhaiensis TaxID=375761 RepID=UPI001CD22693|nr:response regulator transcription factor [Pseudooceanicola nanhaiensis]MCA0921671.1 response regulator transcription factor [Pseudooceanicola nanhaiensis]
MQKILLADDHTLVRQTLAAYLRQAGGYEVQDVATLEEVCSRITASGPFDLILLDFRMPGMDGLEGLRQTISTGAGPVALISGSAPRGVSTEALEMGAIGFLPKTLSPDQTISAVRQMLTGVPYLEREEAETGPLTPRELEVVRGIAAGDSNKEIARNLGVQEVTVKLHVKTLSRKLNARNRTHAAMLARDLRLI